MLQPGSNLELVPDAVTYENIKENKTGEATTSQYEDLDLCAAENQGQYQELVAKPDTSVKLITNKQDITYENTKTEGQNKSDPKNRNEPSQYEELNTGNNKHNEHAYSEVSLR